MNVEHRINVPGYPERTSALDFVGAAFPPGRKPYGLEAAAIVLIRGWKPLPQVLFLVT
jgi:hypothetical protein